MSRRREAADLQKALRLSTQGSIPHSSDILTSSSPIQIPSGFRLAFQSESTQESTNLHPSSHSGSGGTGPPSTFQGFQGGIFAGLQTPVIGSDRSTGALSPTLITIARLSAMAGTNANASSSRDGQQSKADEDEEVVPGSEDEETEEEQPFEVVRRSADNRLLGHSLPPSKPISPMPIPPSETIGSFPTPSGSRHVHPRLPSEATGQITRDVSSPIDGFTTSNSNGTNQNKGSSSSDRPKDTSASSIMLSKPTEIVRARPAPKQRKRTDGDVQGSASVDASGGSSATVEPQSSAPKRMTNDVTTAAVNPDAQISGARARSITPPSKSKTPVVYTKRSINSKKRKTLLSDIESEEDEAAPPTIDQRVLSASLSTTPAEPTKTRSEQNLAVADRPSKKSRTIKGPDRLNRDSSVDPLDLDHLDPLQTPLKTRVVVEIDSANKPKSTSKDEEHDDDEIVVVLPSASKSKTKVKAKGKRAQYDDDDDDDDDPFEGLPLDAAMGDSDEEDDFVPSGRKTKVAAKKKKAPSKKEKKPSTGKKAATSVTPVEPTPTVSIRSEAMEGDLTPNESPALFQVEASETSPAKKGVQPNKVTKAKETTLTQSTFKGSDVSQKNAKYTSNGHDEDEASPTASTSTTNGKGEAAPVEPKAKAVRDDRKSKSKANDVVSDDEDDMHLEAPASKSTVDESVGSAASGSILQVASESQLNVLVKDGQVKSKSPNFVVGKGGKIVEFRNSRDDLPKVVSTTGGVKRMGMSRSFRIPSLHRNLKAPPKRLAAPPKKPERKKKSDDEYSDEEPLDEFGRPKPKPGSKEWYMVED